MGYLLLILFFLTWRNSVQIRKAVNYSTYGTTRNPRNLIRRMFIKLADIRLEESEKKKQQKAEKTDKDNVNNNTDVASS
ncbi:MAG: hypothetical protein ACLR9U_08655 [Lachnospira sp.]|nr:hypothetical protein [Eubacterium sp.]